MSIERYPKAVMVHDSPESGANELQELPCTVWLDGPSVLDGLNLSAVSLRESNSWSRYASGVWPAWKQGREPHSYYRPQLESLAGKGDGLWAVWMGTNGIEGDAQLVGLARLQEVRQHRALGALSVFEVRQFTNPSLAQTARLTALALQMAAWRAGHERLTTTVNADTVGMRTARVLHYSGFTGAEDLIREDDRDPLPDDRDLVTMAASARESSPEISVANLPEGAIRRRMALMRFGGTVTGLRQITIDGEIVPSTEFLPWSMRSERK